MLPNDRFTGSEAVRLKGNRGFPACPRKRTSRSELLPPPALGERCHRGLASRPCPLRSDSARRTNDSNTLCNDSRTAGALALIAPTITDQSMNTKTSEGVTCITPPAPPPVTSSVLQALADRLMRCCTNRRTMVRQQKGTTMKTLITALALAALIAATQSPALAQLMGW